MTAFKFLLAERIGGLFPEIAALGAAGLIPVVQTVQAVHAGLPDLAFHAGWHG